MAIYITGDTHGDENRFRYVNSAFEKKACKEDTLIVCGDFGFIFNNTYQEKEFLDIFIEKPYTTCFIDGNHENFEVLNAFPVEDWNGGKVHIIKRDKAGNAKLIHLMRGQVFEIEGKRIFTFGGACSLDKQFRKPFSSWWHEEMPTDDEYKEGLQNLKKYNFEVDFIVTHTAPLYNLCLHHKEIVEERPLNNFLQYIDEAVEYKHWYYGHFHDDLDIDEKHTLLFFQVRDIETNREVAADIPLGIRYIFGNQNKVLRRYRDMWKSDINSYGVFMLTGVSGCGKTTFLKALVDNSKVDWVSKEEIKKEIVDNIRHSIPFRTPSSQIIFIEFLDDILTSEYSYKYVKDILKKWAMDDSGNKRLIICTFSDVRKAEKFDYPIIRMQPIKITANVVRQKADDMNVSLTASQLRNLADLDNMIDVVSELNYISSIV